MILWSWKLLQRTMFIGSRPEIKFNLEIVILKSRNRIFKWHFMQRTHCLIHKNTLKSCVWSHMKTYYHHPQSGLKHKGIIIPFTLEKQQYISHYWFDLISRVSLGIGHCYLCKEIWGSLRNTPAVPLNKVNVVIKVSLFELQVWEKSRKRKQPRPVRHPSPSSTSKSRKVKKSVL